MGFHWDWFAIHKIEADLTTRLFDFTGFPARKVVPGLTFEQAANLMQRYTTARQDSAAACTFQDWTMIRGSAILASKSAGEVAKLFGAHTCLAYAESTTWALGFEYGLPDGTVRRRSFVVDGWKDVGVAQVRDPLGRKVLAWDLAPKALIGPDKTLRRPETVGREESEGKALEGEPAGLLVSDEKNLLQVLAALKVPVGQAAERYVGSFDYGKGVALPGLGSAEKAFTFYGLGDEPANEAPLKQPTVQPQQRRSGFFRRFSKG